MDILDDLPWYEHRTTAGQESVCVVVTDERDDLANLPMMSRDEALKLLGIDGRQGDG